MKIFKFIVLSSILLIGLSCGFYGCQKEPYTQTQADADTEAIDLNKVRARVEGNTLHFVGDEMYFQESEWITNASESQLDTWEKQVGFRSYRTIVNEAEAELEYIQNSAELEKFKAKYSHLFIYGDEEITPKIRHPYYASIANEEGVFYVGQAVFKALENKVVEVRNGDISQLQQAEQLEESSRDKNVFVYKINRRVVSNTCNSHIRAFRETSNKRKVHLEMFTITESCGCGVYRVKVCTKVWGQKKAFGWRRYKTILNFECGAYTVQIAGNNYSHSGWSGSSGGEAKSLVKCRYEGDPFYYNVNSTFVRARSRANSRGVGFNWGFFLGV